MKILEYVLLQNYLISFATSFHKNACFPSQIVSISLKNPPEDGFLSERLRKEFDESVENFKEQMMEVLSNLYSKINRVRKEEGQELLPEIITKNIEMEAEVQTLNSKIGSIDGEVSAIKFLSEK